MIVELHLIQNFAPANLNRDDTGAPKDCEFGGYRRARISSQCLKRAIRTTFKTEQLIPAAHLADRTKRVVDAVVDRLQADGKPKDAARAVVEAILEGVGLTVGDDGKTQYLLFLGHDEITRLADLCLAQWDTLAVVVPTAAPEPTAPTRGRGTARDAKRRGKDAVPSEIRQALLAVLDGGKAADLALFGRMLADLPDKNIDAASQVAHAISTNKISMEFDFYTAVDDLRPQDTAGADMLGTIEFNSACFYRYANVNLAQLTHNLGDDRDLARQTLAAFLRASITAIPTGKQNSMAAQNPPSFLLAVVREHGCWSLANAFLQPTRPDATGDLVQHSIAALDRYWGQLSRMYGTAGISATAAVSLADDAPLDALAGARVPDVTTLVDRVLATAGVSA